MDEPVAPRPLPLTEPLARRRGDEPPVMMFCVTEISLKAPPAVTMEKLWVGKLVFMMNRKKAPLTNGNLSKKSATSLRRMTAVTNHHLQSISAPVPLRK